MTKFRTDVTKGGYKILSIHGPDGLRTFSGVVQHNDEYVAVNWDGRGQDVDFDGEYDLIPLDEPKHDSTVVTDKLQYSLDTCMDKLHDLDQRLALEMKRNDELYKDAIARVNGLRNDYLADKDAVSPARVDDLEERVEDAHETAAFANRKVVAWTDRLEALETRLNKNDSEFVKLDHLTKETDRHLNTVGDLAQRACLQGVKLNQRLEVLERIVQEQSDKRQPSDTKILEAAQALVDAIASQVNTNLSWKDVNLNLLVPGYLLEGVRPLFKKGTQTSDVVAMVKPTWAPADVVVTPQPNEKGVWVKGDLLKVASEYVYTTVGWLEHSEYRVPKQFWELKDVVDKANQLGLEE